MYISVQSICNSPDFKDVKVIAGKNGLHRNINKVSVADLKANRSEKSYYEPGCLFISSLEFFEDCTEKEKYEKQSQLLADFVSENFVKTGKDGSRTKTGAEKNSAPK